MSFIKNQRIAFLVFLIFALYFLYLVSDVIMPFIVALIFAYFLSPLLDRMTALKVPRGIASIILTTLFFLLLATFIIMLMPPIYTQVVSLVDKLNTYKAAENPELLDEAAVWLDSFSPETLEVVEEAIQNLSRQIFSFAGTIFSSLFASSVAAFHAVSLVIITPIVTFYVLRDWNKLVEKAKEVLPIKHKKEIIAVGKDINATLSGYLRGQTLVCLFLGIYYAIALSIIKLDSAVILGIACGFFTFVPYFGAILGGLLCVLIATIQFASLKYSMIVLIIFGFGQFVEGNFVAPKILGEKVGLHPVWIMFGLLAGGSLLGFFGILIAVPLTAIVGVAVKWLFNKYKEQKR